MKTLQEFVDEHGFGSIIRRHFEYRIPMMADLLNLGLSLQTIMAMVYTRQLDPAQLGLDTMGVRGAIEHGLALARMQIIPSIFFHGHDQRNFDGARLTAETIAEEINTHVPCREAPVTYPIYSEVQTTANALLKHGDTAVHRVLSGNMPNLWTESVGVFRARIEKSIHQWADEGSFWDLNYEALVLLYYIYIKRFSRLSEIPFDDESAWQPQKGGGIIIGCDGNTCATFSRQLELLEIVT